MDELAQHLAAVKLEAAETKHLLKQQVHDLSQQVAELEIEREEQAAELSHCRSHIEQLKVQNSTKYRMEERSNHLKFFDLDSQIIFISDDWRAFSDSIQKDRRRLEEEKDELECSNRQDASIRNTV